MVVARPIVASVFLLLLVVSLAGCLGGDDPEPSGPQSPGPSNPGGGGGGGGGSSGGGSQGGDGHGEVAGIVLDDGYMPVHGASVRLTRDGSTIQHVSTSGNGRFLFEEVPVGTYRLEATAACCRDQVERVEVRADQTVTRDLLLDRLSGDEMQRPFVADDVWTGLISCGVNILGVSQEDHCAATDESADSRHAWNVTAGLRTLFLHVEWEGQPTGPDLTVRVSGLGDYVYGELDGESPVQLRIDNDAIEEPAMRFENIDGQREIVLEVLPGGEAGVVFQQSFRVIILEFHWRPAAENFEFSMG
jgi:hypothetical protein